MQLYTSIVYAFANNCQSFDSKWCTSMLLYKRIHSIRVDLEFRSLSIQNIFHSKRIDAIFISFPYTIHRLVNKNYSFIE